jgi:hypothetical protein
MAALRSRDAIASTILISREEIKMRLAIVVSAIAAPLLLGATPSVAQRPNPWCLKATMGEDYTVDLCYFRTYEQCARERISYGTTSFCIVNPEYYFRYGEPEQSPRKPRRSVVR